MHGSVRQVLMCILAATPMFGLALGADPLPETLASDQSPVKTPLFDLPEYRVVEGAGSYTGFNSLNLQEIYLVQKQLAVRSQIAPRGGHKPCLALLPNGDLLATQYANGEICLCRSTDQGLSWGAPQGTGFKAIPGNRAAQFSALKDGTLLLNYEGIHRSEDDGKTWQKCAMNWSVTIDDNVHNDFIFGETDGFHELADGTVVCSGYIALPSKNANAFLLRSKDGGKTWDDGSYIADASEVNIAVLAGDRLFACLRAAALAPNGAPQAGEGGAIVKVTESNDAGRTWTAPRLIGLGMAQIPGYPVLLKDGRLLLIYGNRQFPFGAQAIASVDGGKTWDTEHPIILAWFSWDNYCGMPRSVLLPDGSIVTGYYAHVFKENENVNQDVFGQTVHWRVPDDWPKRWPPVSTPVTAPAGKQPSLDLPQFRARTAGSGIYTGFNSVNMQEIYVVEKKPAVRSQIVRNWGKPIIVRLPNGHLLASQYRKNPQVPLDPRLPEEGALCVSRDEGLSWSAPRLLGIPGRVTQLAVLKDGTLILANHYSIYRSTDEGQTWKQCSVNWSATIENKARNDFTFDETNGTLEMPDGTLMCCGYIELAPGQVKSYVLRSRDGGRTWGDGSFAANASEISYVLLSSGKLLGFARTTSNGLGEGGAYLTLIESSDGGRNWTSQRPFGLGQTQVPGFPIDLKDGRILLIYGNRQFPFGAQAIASRDGGKTWDTEHPIILAWFSWDNYCGHPRSLVMPDGSIMTGYYTSVFRDSQPMVSHALRWRVPDNWPPSPPPAE